MRTVAGNLAALFGTPRVAVAPIANLQADCRVTIDVQRFDSLAAAHSRALARVSTDVAASIRADAARKP